MIRGKVLLIKSSSEIDADPLNHKEKLTITEIPTARITELSGAQRQIDIMGERYDHSFTIRLIGKHTCDYIAFPDEYDEEKKEPKYTVSSIRNHHNRTDIYAFDTKVKS